MAHAEPRSTSNGILFTVNVDSVQQQCLISKEALDKLSLLKNIDATDASAMEIFKAFEAYIRPVAQSLIKTKAATALLQLTPESIASAYSENTQH